MIEKALESISEETGTNTRKVESLENEKVTGLENSIKALNEHNKTNGQRLDTLDNTSEQ